MSAVATIGFFDGVHLGHQYLLNELKLLARHNDANSLVVTFNNHPQTFFYFNSDIKLLTLPEEKKILFARNNIDKFLFLDFDQNIASLSAEQFLLKLKTEYQITHLLMGHDHRFGSDKLKADQYESLGEKLGVKILRAHPVIQDEKIISSSKIRHYLADGAIAEANNMLGYPYELSGSVISGNQLGRTIGFPTANLLVDANKLIPALGVYEVTAAVRGQHFRAMLNIGFRPTIGGNAKSIEVHLIDFNEDIYNEMITLTFIRKIRDEFKFDSIDALQRQIEIDKQSILD